LYYSKINILIGPVEISGIAASLAEGFRQCNVNAELAFSSKHKFAYGGKECSGTVYRLCQSISIFRKNTDRKFIFRKIIAILLQTVLSFIFLFFLLKKFNAFIYIAGETITNTEFELWLLKFFKKKIIFVYLGSDSRPPYMSGGKYAGLASDPIPSGFELFRETCRIKKQIKMHEKYANYIVNSPTVSHFHEKIVINWFEMGLPKFFNQEKYLKTKISEKSKCIRILHSPSKSLAKGTIEITSAIERLRNKGYEIEFVKIEGMSNEIVLDEIFRCDFVVDQLYSDSPMAAFSAEAAYFGKPTVVAGYAKDFLKKYLREDSMPPSIYTSPDFIEEAIEKLIVDVEYRLALGENARKFVNEKWDLQYIAGKYLKLLNDEPELNWFFDPNNVDYLEGSGLSCDRSKKMISELIKYAGFDSLAVSDKKIIMNKIKGLFK